MNKSIDELRLLIRENDYPYFSDEELKYWLDKSDTVEESAYRCLILKSEDTTLSISGLSASDTSSYFKRLASRFKPNNSGILK
jgi:hypothetical protein